MEAVTRVLNVLGGASVIVCFCMIVWSFFGGYAGKIHQMTTICSFCCSIIFLGYSSFLKEMLKPEPELAPAPLPHQEGVNG